MARLGPEVECDVGVPSHLSHGVYANAIRVLPGRNGQCCLEFLLYSGNTQRAQVVGKVTIATTLLPVIQSSLSFILEDTSLDVG